MKKLAFILSIFMFFGFTTLGNATIVTQNFSIDIDYAIVDNIAAADVAALGYGPLPSLGSIFHGEFTYDDSNIPESGKWYISNVNSVYVDEVQDFQFEWFTSNPYVNSIFVFVGSSDPIEYWLPFTNGKFDGYGYHWSYDGIGWTATLDLFNDQDMDATGTYFDRYHINVEKEYWVVNPNNPNGGQWIWAGYHLGGNAHFVPEPSIMLLLGLSLVGLAGVRRSMRRRNT